MARHRLEVEESGDSLTPEQKLAKIEEMMHPGYWSTFDSRRDKILEVIGSTRKEWRGGNPFE